MGAGLFVLLVWGVQKLVSMLDRLSKGFPGPSRLGRRRLLDCGFGLGTCGRAWKSSSLLFSIPICCLLPVGTRIKARMKFKGRESMHITGFLSFTSIHVFQRPIREQLMQGSCAAKRLSNYLPSFSALSFVFRLNL